MSELSQIKPGARVLVKVTMAPTNAAARKTIQRVLSKDPLIKADNARLRAIRTRDYAPSRRGGRMYGGRVVKQQPVSGRRGESATVTASLDVLRDLASVARFVEVRAV